jgi:hypothetical protein
MKRFAFVLAILVLLLPAACFAGPFGFNYGMTKDQVVHIVGGAHIIKDEGYILQVTTAPKPDDRFEVYLLIFSPEKGLLKIIATGKTIDTDQAGTELRANFGAMRDSFSKQYGAPAKTLDLTAPDNMLSHSSGFADALSKRLRVLACNWSLDGPKSKASDHLIGVILQAKGLRKNAGWLEVSYEFDGFSQFAESVQKSQEEKTKQN